jgi:uncharacterized protein YxeA
MKNVVLIILLFLFVLNIIAWLFVFNLNQRGEDNPYGHPYPQTLETLEKYGIKVLRTDKDGDIKIISNGKEYVISYF